LNQSRPIRVLASAGVVMAATTAAGIVPGTAYAAGGPSLSIFAGTGAAGTPTPGPATSSAMNTPNGIAFDSSGNIYLVDSDNNLIERVTPAGTLTIFAGTGAAGAPTPGPATSSKLDGPGAIVFDSAGNAYVADSGNNEVERIAPSGTLSIFAGTGATGAPTPGPATSSRLNSLNQIAIDSSGNIYIADSGNSIVEKVTPSGTLSTFAGTGAAGTPTPGPATLSRLNYPGGVAVDSLGNVYIADFGNDVVEKVTPSGTLSIFAGNGTVGAPTSGWATSSKLGGPAFLAVNSSNDVYIADFGENMVEKVTSAGALSIFAGTGVPAGPTPGPATLSRLNQPVGVAVDPAGDVFIGDAGNNVVEKVTLPAPTAPIITNLPSSGTVGSVFTIAITTSGDGPLWVTSSTPTVCSVSGLTVSFGSAGTCSLTAHVGPGSTYGAGSGTPQAFSVAPHCSGGYWIAGADGAVYPFGHAVNYGSLVSSGVTPTRPIIGITATADCRGYWLVAGDGGVFAFGDATYFGSMGGHHLNQPVVGMAATAQGGYYEVASDGGVFSFGPGATYFGSMGGHHLNQPVVGMAATAQGGYYEVASDGGVFSFGPGATYFGSTGCLSLNQPIRSIVVSPDVVTVGKATACGSAGPEFPGGYEFVAGDGGVFSFGNTVFVGSLGGKGITNVVAMANA
jgi:sugar lactone lactonase YvrE